MKFSLTKLVKSIVKYSEYIVNGSFMHFNTCSPKGVNKVGNAFLIVT